MWFWRRAEIYAGVSLQEFNRIRRVLAANGIRYDTRMNNRQRLDFDRRIAAAGRAGYDPRFDTVYYLYVDRRDLDAARDACRKD